jgi:hypothetical protein
VAEAHDAQARRLSSVGLSGASEARELWNKVGLFGGCGRRFRSAARSTARIAAVRQRLLDPS